MPDTTTTTAEFVENPTDCWLTTPDLIELHDRQLWPQGIGSDPFHDPAALFKPRHVIDRRKGGDAYRDPWWTDDVAKTTLANGPYSGDLPSRTTERIARVLFDEPEAEVTNLCPAAPGSEYWKAYVWPNAAAIAWLGRWAFIAGRDLPDKKKPGRMVAHAGERVAGNRTEIALVYSLGAGVRRQRARAERFREIFRDYPAVVLVPSTMVVVPSNYVAGGT
jgi:hypothetical protein